MEQVTTPEVHLPPRQHGDPESSWVVNYMPMIVGAVSLLVLSTVGHAWLEVTTITSASIIFVWLFIVILWGAIGVMHHAEHIALRLGEPLGTLILTLSAILIEVALIASVMLVGAANPTLARDTMYAVLMLVLNGLLGASLLAGGLRHRQQDTISKAPVPSWLCSCRSLRSPYCSQTTRLPPPNRHCLQGRLCSSAS